MPEFIENDEVRVVSIGCMGWRNGNEDKHIVNLDLGDKNMLFCVFDGHLGSEVVELVEEKFVNLLLEQEAYKKKDYKQAFHDTFMAFDPIIDKVKEQILKKANFPGQKESVAGTTATVCLVTPTQYICANAGDSRTVLARSGKVIELSHDHKPTDELEKKRIEAAGSFVDNGRVQGNLAVSRAIGDLFFKRRDVPQEDQPVTAKPDFEIIERDRANDEFIVLACDGLWDSRSSQGMVDIMHKEVYHGDYTKKPT